MDPSYDENLDQALVFIDNSNVFIETQKYSARRKNYLPKVQDSCCRIDYEKIMAVARKNKKLLDAKLYGSESKPPLQKDVWEAIIKKTNITIQSSKRNFNSKEKAVDTALVADAVELIIEKKDPAVNQHFILFSGDRDMIPLVHKAIKHGWHAHLWAYTKSITHKFKKEARQNSDKITIHYMEKYFEEFTFSEYYFEPKKIPLDRSLVLTFLEAPHTPELNAFVRDIGKTASSVFGLPTKGRFLKENPNKFLVVVYPEETTGRGHEASRSSARKDFLYEFNLHVFSKASLLQEKLKHCTEVKTYLKHSETKDDSDLAVQVQMNGGPKVYEKELRAPGSTEGFTTVRGKKQKLKKRENCKYGFCCNKIVCQYNHSKEEKEYFKDSTVPLERRWKYKSSMCRHGDSCRFKGRSHVCSSAHNISELRCLNCKKFGHGATDCPQENGIKNKNVINKPTNTLIKNNKFNQK